MFAKLFVLVCLVVCSNAKTPEDFKRWFLQLGLQCNGEFPISQEEMQKVQRHELPDTKNVKCLIGCVFKKTKWLGEDGMVKFDKAVAAVDNELEGGDDKKANAKKLIDECRPVNEQTVSDGTAGCERAYILAACLIEHGPKFGFDLKHITL